MYLDRSSRSFFPEDSPDSRRCRRSLSSDLLFCLLRPLVLLCPERYHRGPGKRGGGLFSFRGVVCTIWKLNRAESRRVMAVRPDLVRMVQQGWCPDGSRVPSLMISGALLAQRSLGLTSCVSSGRCRRRFYQLSTSANEVQSG